MYYILGWMVRDNKQNQTVSSFYKSDISIDELRQFFCWKSKWPHLDRKNRILVGFFFSAVDIIKNMIETKQNRIKSNQSKSKRNNNNNEIIKNLCIRLIESSERDEAKRCILEFFF